MRLRKEEGKKRKKIKQKGKSRKNKEKEKENKKGFLTKMPLAILRFELIDKPGPYFRLNLLFHILI